MEKKDLAYQIVFDRIIEELDKGNVPWRKTWANFNPMNGKSKRQYHGINFWLLSLSPYSDPRWFTFKQVVELGGNVKKGSKGTPVVFWTLFETDKTNKNGDPVKVPFLKYSTVFNADQTEGLDLPALTKKTFKPIQNGEDMLANYKMGPKITAGAQPGYSPKTDEIHMPKPEYFTTPEEYYVALAHEAIHSTGVEYRLNRNGVSNFDYFGSEAYSNEELTAELGATFLCHALGIDIDLPNSAAYIAGWKKYLKDNMKVLVKAATQAQKATDFILGTDEDEAPTPITVPAAEPEKELVPA